MTDISVSRLDGQDLRMPITATKDGLPYDPTSDAVSVAVLPTGTQPASIRNDNAKTPRRMKPPLPNLLCEGMC